MTGSVASACSPRPASAATTPARPTTPSVPASRWATRSRRSGSSRPASSCSTPSSSSASRTWAVPASPAPPARRRDVAVSAWTSTCPRCPGARTGMEPWEVMTSESQERMLAIVTPESWPAVAAICAKWEVRATVIGTVTAPDPDGGGRLRIRDGLDGPVLADVPAASLSDDAPLYDRPRRAPTRRTTAAAGAAGRLRGRSPHPVALARAGSTASTTTSSSSTRWSGPGPMPRCCAWPGRACPIRTGAWPSRPTPTPAPARSTREAARRSCSPRRSPTWPASGRRPSRWSTASTSGTPSTPR